LLFGLNGMKLDVLDGRTSSTRRLCASKPTIKTSASIATTFFDQSRTVTKHTPGGFGNCDGEHRMCW
jgi:hypothetical protein